MKVVLAGPDRGLIAPFEERGASVAHVEGIVTAEKLVDAGIRDADIFVLTNVEEATAIPIAVEENPAVRVVVYSPDTVPEFVRGQLDLAIDPALLDAEVVVEELTAA